ncbi:amino acid adenylation domain-containing protein [Aquincola sp. MAHUQ-54]|uniref:Amino acid adenylation domain-containing protein n=1 Tax=Aquincola agrisoli TaxID=3119538 RepID=A0AAW9QCI6_9BURK
MTTALPPHIEAVYPLAPTQRGLLFHSLYAPASSVYFVQLAFDLHGPLDTAAFDAAWQALATHHAVLRTAFAWDKLDAPLQVVGRSVRLAVTHAEAHAMTPSAFDDWLAADRRQGFDLRRAPLARVHCLRLADDHHRVVFSHHHLLLDGWSLPLLLRDWQTAYRAALDGTAPALAPAPSYRDHVEWLAAQDTAAARAFWRTLLAGFDTPSTPGFVRPAPQATSTTATPPLTLRHTLGIDDTQALHTLARRLRVTPGTVLQGAWAVLLARSSGSDDVVYGLTRAGRPASRPQAAGTVGLFITTLPVRMPLPAAQPLAEGLAALQARVLAQQPHEHLAPAEVQRAAATLTGQPLFDSVVVIENYPGGPAAPDAPLRLGDVRVSESTHYPLSLYAVLGDTIELRLLADPQRVPAASAARCLAALPRLLRGFATRPGAALGEFLLADDTALAALRDADRKACQPMPRPLVPEAVAALAQAAPEADVLVDAQGPLDRAGLQTLAAEIATRLAAQGVAPGHRVGVSLARGRGMLATLLAVWRLGAAYVPMDAAYPEARLRHMAADAGLHTLVLHATTGDALAWWTGSRCDLDAPAPGGTAPAPAPIDAATPAYLIYTSGSTGTPKGVAITHGNLANMLAAMNGRIGLAAADRWLAVTTLSFDIAALELFGPLVAGACTVIATEAEARDGERLAARLTRARITVLQATPSTWRLLGAVGWQAPAGLKLLCGGEALDRPLARSLLAGGAALWNVYGPTETTVWSTALHVTPALLDADEAAGIGGPVPVGDALANTTLRVLDADLRPLPPGVPGELCIGGAGVSPGYHRRAALTADRFVPDPLAAGDGPAAAFPTLYRTGDRAAWREDGLIDFLGRLDHQAKLRGQRLELGEVEAALIACAGVVQAVAVIEGEGAAARLVGYVVADRRADDAPAFTASLRTQLAARLPAAMVPAALRLLPALPLTPNGKIDRRALRPAPSAGNAVPAAAATPLEAALLALWRELLQQPQLSPHDHFFESGGHSLLLVTLQSRLRQMGHELALVDLFNHPTVASLAARLQAGTPAAAAQAAAETAARAAGRNRLMQRRRTADPSPQSEAAR